MFQSSYGSMQSKNLVLILTPPADKGIIAQPLGWEKYCD